MTEFGAFRYDAESRVLSRDEAEIPLAPRVLAVLESLLKRPGKIGAQSPMFINAGLLSFGRWLTRRDGMRSRFLWRASRARYRDQRIELAEIRAAIRADGIAVDVGANRGSYLYWLSRWTPAGRVVAFEPQADLARYLRAVASAMHLDNVTVEDRGVSKCPGELEFYVPGGRVTPGASFSRRVAERESCTHESKEVVTLDGYFDAGAPISVVKVDVEGLELPVFEGAARILEESSPLLVFECENRHLENGSVDDVFFAPSHAQKAAATP